MSYHGDLRKPNFANITYGSKCSFLRYNVVDSETRGNLAEASDMLAP